MKNTKLANPDHRSTENPTAGSEGINPSAPTAGTEAYGTTADERRVLGKSNEYDSRAALPSSEGAGDIRRTSYPRNEPADNPAARTGEAKGSNSEAEKPTERNGETRGGETRSSTLKTKPSTLKK